MHSVSSHHLGVFCHYLSVFSHYLSHRVHVKHQDRTFATFHSRCVRAESRKDVSRLVALKYENTIQDNRHISLSVCIGSPARLRKRWTQMQAFEGLHLFKSVPSTSVKTHFTFRPSMLPAATSLLSDEVDFTVNFTVARFVPTLFVGQAPRSKP